MFHLICILAGLAVLGASPAIPPELTALQGTYTGQWTLFGINAEGEVVRKTAWTDKLVTGSVQLLPDRMFVSWVNEQTFEGTQRPPTKVEGKEGFFLRNGKLGDGYIEMFGQTLRLIRLSDNTASYVAPATPPELAMLGFPKGATGQHVLVKVTTTEQGQPTHRVSRITTASYTDAQGNPRTVQFVSLRGYHRKQP